MDTAFNGEHLLPGQLGQFFIVLAFGSALLSTISYYFAATNKDKFDKSWHNLGRIGFYANTVSVIGIGTCLFYIIFNHLFEYYYAWEHSSRSLPTYYIISCFWEGQEGSFWHSGRLFRQYIGMEGKVMGKPGNDSHYAGTNPFSLHVAWGRNIWLPRRH